MRNIYGVEVVEQQDKEFTIGCEFEDNDANYPVLLSFYKDGAWWEASPGSNEWNTLFNYIASQPNNEVIVQGHTRMYYHPGKSHTLYLSIDGNINNMHSIYVEVIDDVNFPHFEILYIPGKNKTEYNMLNWFGASAEERLIVLEPGKNNDYDISEDNVILPPWLDISLYGDRLDALSGICYDNAYNRTYINVTLKLYDPDMRFGYNNYSKVYQGQLYIGYNKDNDEYEAHITTCDGDYVIKYENVEEGE